MSIAQAIADAAREANWSPTKIAAEAGVTEAAAKFWIAGKKIPGGDKLELLRRKLPGLAERLDSMAAA